MNKEERQCQNCKNTFAIDTSDLKFYEKMQVPPPTFCPECRLQRRLAWRNERSLYRRKCDLCGKDTITMYHPKGGVVNYCGPCWWSDKWNPLDYGMDYDFSKPFFVQFRELMLKVPHQNTSVSYKTLVNSDYNNMNHWLKNCYWLFNSDYDEDCLYGEEVEHSKDSVDITMIDHSQFIHQSVNCNKCYQVYFSQDCESSHDIWFSKNLVNCSNCFGCVNLKNQQYQIFNKSYPKEEYFKKLKEFNLGSYQNIENLKHQFEEFKLKFPYKYMHGRNNTNVSGDYIYYSKNVHDTYIATESENCRYCMWLIVKLNKDCYDFTQFGENTQQVYEAMSCGKGIQNVIGGISVLEGHSMFYSMYCWNNCANIFGCIGLRSKKYCILNKQYSENEYHALLPKIIRHMNEMPYISKSEERNSKSERNLSDQNPNVQAHDIVYRYGEFFPAELSHFGYNETSALEFFPLTKEQALEKGYPWKEPEVSERATTLIHSQLPDHINDLPRLDNRVKAGVPDSIVNEIISCEHKAECSEQCTTAFRIIPAELKFYKKHGLPLPRLCPNCRHYQRLKLRNPLKLWHRKCTCAGEKSENSIYQNTVAHFHKTNPCPNEFETTYAPDRPEIVYCEQCYQVEVA